MAVGDLKNSAGFLRFRERVGSRGREARDRVVSGPVSRPLDGRHRTESGGGLITATMEPLAMSQVVPGPEPPSTFQVNDSGSHDSVFGVAASDGLDFTCSSEVTKLSDIRAVVSAARFAIKTLVVTRLDPNATYIRERTFANGK